MQMSLDDLKIGSQCFVVAEIGNNHEGNFESACELIRQAAIAGADAVKFQRFHAEELVQKDQPTLAHAAGVHKTQRERLRSLEFTDGQWEDLAKLSTANGAMFFATPFDEASADALDSYVSVYKIASGDLTHLPLIRHIASKNKPIILSTGMGSVEEIADALEILPKNQIVILHCVSSYPTPSDEVNLRAIPFLSEHFGVPVGYSDHTVGTTAALAAVALGAVVIEKHFTLDKTQPIGDHKLSAEPDEFRMMVSQIREIEKMTGTPGKVPSEKEINMRGAMRRSLYARRDIPAGRHVRQEDLVVMRPGRGLPPKLFDSFIGKESKRNLDAEVLVDEGDFK